jgi:hypothetical protein
MEDMIKEKLCTFCNSKRNNCKKIEIHKKDNCIIYKCLNYQKKDNVKEKSNG